MNDPKEPSWERRWLRKCDEIEQEMRELEQQAATPEKARRRVEHSYRTSVAVWWVLFAATALVLALAIGTL